MRIRLDLGYDGTNFAGWAKQPGQRTVQGTLEDGLARVIRVPKPPDPAVVLRTATRRSERSISSVAGSPDPTVVLRTATRGSERSAQNPSQPTQPISVTVAGRTDAGVHARGQVVHFDIPPDAWAALAGRSDRNPAQALIDRLVGVLPSDLVVHRASLAPPGFDARFSALCRTYEYRIADQIADRDPQTRNYVLWNRRPLDVAAMHQSMQPLIGLHDFAAFCRPRPGATTIREVQEITWERIRPSAGALLEQRASNETRERGLIVGNITADAFCHNLVRALVGAAIAVGEGRKSIAWPLEVLRSGQREQAAAVAPAHGLTLQYVTYPPDQDLAARAEAIRAKRELP